MGEKWVEVKVMYCKDLKLFNFFQKLNVYAVVSLVEEDGEKKKQEQEQRTPTDNEGDGNPEWNHVMRFDIGSVNDDDLSRMFLHFDLRSESNGGILVAALGGERCIGQVWVPLKDIVSSPPSFVNYEVRTLDGKSNGVINFSFNLKPHPNLNNNLPTINVHPYPPTAHHQNPSSPAADLYYDAVTCPVTPYSPHQGYYQYPPSPHHHHFSPFRPVLAYPPLYTQPPQQQQQQTVPYAYPPEHLQVSSPNWTHQPHPTHLYSGGDGGGGYNYFHGPGTPIASQTTTWPLHFPPAGDDHLSPPSWNNTR